MKLWTLFAFLIIIIVAVLSTSVTADEIPDPDVYDSDTGPGVDTPVNQSEEEVETHYDTYDDHGGFLPFLGR